MDYLKINGAFKGFDTLGLYNILPRIIPFADDFVWSIQCIEAVGYVKQIFGMDIVELEVYCHEAKRGYILPFSSLVQLSGSCKDIIDITVVACKELQCVPSFKDSNWEAQCDVIITRHDSSLWELYSTDERIMNEFRVVFESMK